MVKVVAVYPGVGHKDAQPRFFEGGKIFDVDKPGNVDPGLLHPFQLLRIASCRSPGHDYEIFGWDALLGEDGLCLRCLQASEDKQRSYQCLYGVNLKLHPRYSSKNDRGFARISQQSAETA